MNTSSSAELNKVTASDGQSMAFLEVVSNLKWKMVTVKAGNTDNNYLTSINLILKVINI